MAVHRKWCCSAPPHLRAADQGPRKAGFTSRARRCGRGPVAACAIGEGEQAASVGFGAITLPGPDDEVRTWLDEPDVPQSACTTSESGHARGTLSQLARGGLPATP